MGTTETVIRYRAVFRFRGMILCAGLVIAALLLLVNCSRSEQNRMQGYVEGEFIYVASPYAGTLHTLHVQRGRQVKAGNPLFSLESTAEKDLRDEAERRLAQVRANLEDAKKGRRPTEIDSVEAQLRQAEAALALSENDLLRQEKLLRSAATSIQDLDRARSTRDQNRQRVAQLGADLKTAYLGSRTDQIAAAEAGVRAQQALLAKTEWDLSQKSQTAPEASLVFDTLYREGEWVAAGRPVVALLSPRNTKVRVFVPEPQIGRIHPEDRVKVFADGVKEPFIGKVSFISPQAEYTPPVIFSRDSRSKLVFMIEIVFDAKTAANLHPGQPVDVQFGM